jgi:hypothetical protein
MSYFYYFWGVGIKFTALNLPRLCPLVKMSGGRSGILESGEIKVMGNGACRRGKRMCMWTRFSCDFFLYFENCMVKIF